MSHEHHHNHHTLNSAFWLTALFAGVELMGGWIGNSLALLADAGHMISDVAALGLAMLAGRIAQRPAHQQMTFGYGRIKVLAAQMNGLMLWFLSGWIIWSAVERLANPPQVQGGIVLWIASVGLVVNLVMIRWLHGGHTHDLNLRAAYWHVIGDALGSVAAMVAGSVILLTGWMPIDPILSFVVAIILIWGGWQIIRDTTMELMEAVPSEVNPKTIRQYLQQTDGVLGVHHIHLWRLPTGALAISAHIQVTTMQIWPQILACLIAELQQQGIEHATLQPEIIAAGTDCPSTPSS